MHTLTHTDTRIHKHTGTHTTEMMHTLDRKTHTYPNTLTGTDTYIEFNGTFKNVRTHTALKPHPDTHG